MPFRLDGTDIRLLTELQLRGDRSLSQIAAKLSVSPSTLTRRMVALQGAKIIVGTVAVVDAKKVGRPLSFVINVRMESTRPEDLEDLTAWIKAEPSFQQALMPSNEAGLVITATAANPATFNALMVRFQEDNPVVREVSSRLVTETVKQSLFVPIGPNGADL
jgi:Lrp/AsnC family transcriptional regulator, leucine-responsive regulatory protein